MDTLTMRPNEPSQPLIWVHGDCLRPTNPALIAFPAAPRVFVFDIALLSEYHLTFKRLVFLYECVLEIPQIQIYKGDVVAELARLAAQNATDRIVTTVSPSPRHARQVAALRKAHHLNVEVLAEPPFVSIEGPGRDEDADLDLKRFSRYWASVSRAAMRLDEDDPL